MDDRVIADRIAHDLKAALSPIQTSAYVLRRDDGLAPATRAEVIAVIERQTHRLARMIDEASEWRRAVDGTIGLRPAKVEPGLLLELATGGLPGRPVLACNVDTREGFVGDAYRLQQLLVALVAFACRRDPQCTPVCTITATDHWLRIAVVDRGPACDPAAVLRQPDPAPSDQGLGLGLLTAAAIARLHGGTLRAEASEAGGLRFECEVAALRVAPS